MQKFMKKNRWIYLETGQAMVEFALILPILILFLMLPLEYHRVVKTKLLLDTAASDALLHTEGQFDNVHAYESAAQNYLSAAYGGEFEGNDLKVQIKIDPKGVNQGPEHFHKENYIYRVYTSEKADQNYDERFEQRDSNFKTVQVSMQLFSEVTPITLIGKEFFGDKVKLHTRKYMRNIYVEGFQEE